MDTTNKVIGALESNNPDGSGDTFGNALITYVDDQNKITVTRIDQYVQVNQPVAIPNLRCQTDARRTRYAANMKSIAAASFLDGDGVLKYVVFAICAAVDGADLNDPGTVELMSMELASRWGHRLSTDFGLWTSNDNEGAVAAVKGLNRTESWLPIVARIHNNVVLSGLNLNDFIQRVHWVQKKYKSADPFSVGETRILNAWYVARGAARRGIFTFRTVVAAPADGAGAAAADGAGAAAADGAGAGAADDLGP